MGLAFSQSGKGIVSQFLPFLSAVNFLQIALYKLTRMNFDATYMIAHMCKRVCLECILIIQLKMSVGLRMSKIITTTP